MSHSGAKAEKVQDELECQEALRKENITLNVKVNDGDMSRGHRNQTERAPISQIRDHLASE